MGRKSDIPPHLVAQIAALRDAGFTQQVISARLHVSQSSVHKCLVRMREGGGYNARKRTGRPRMTSGRTDSLIRRIVTANPTASASFIATQLPEDVQPSEWTIRRRLRKDFDLKAYRPARKPLLSTKNIKDRLSFCKAHRSWSVDDWCRVMFSDESQIRQFHSYAPTIRRPPGQRCNKRFTLPSVKHSPSVMVWGVISARGPIELWPVPPKTTVNAAIYQQILEDRLCEGMKDKNCTTFQHDGAPCHKAKRVRDWLNAHNIQLLENWPGSSPDLNPIENCWATVKREVAKLKQKSQSDLLMKVKAVWEEHITEDYCRKLVSSMPSRIAAVLKAKGGHSKY